MIKFKEFVHQLNEVSVDGIMKYDRDLLIKFLTSVKKIRMTDHKNKDMILTWDKIDAEKLADKLIKYSSSLRPAFIHRADEKTVEDFKELGVSVKFD